MLLKLGIILCSSLRDLGLPALLSLVILCATQCGKGREELSRGLQLLAGWGNGRVEN